MARCALNVSHPKFKKLVDKQLKNHPDFYKCLDNFVRLVFKDYKLSGWVLHPMPGFPQYQNRVWKWDFKPGAIDQSGTRKGWRLYALAASSKPGAHPTPADAFFCYDKDDQPKGDSAKWLAEQLRNFLREDAVPVLPPEELFRHFVQSGQMVSVCLNCYVTVFVSESEAEIDMAQKSHQCPN